MNKSSNTELLPGVKIVGFIDLSEVNYSSNTNRTEPIKDNYSSEPYGEDQLLDEVWEDECRRFEWLQSMYAKGYTYDDIYGKEEL